jgi:hypothetical protein
MPSPLPIALVVHGHFYQPPRENPWTDAVPREPSAAPFHDWNARINAESYRANAFARVHDGAGRIEAIVNNYERLSFNFGPTLARWVWRHDPTLADRLRAADAAERKRFGHGGAIAQAYAHPIIPLCNPADRRTQLLWGLSDFRRRFDRAAEGLWLPETGVSPETLETLIELGVSYTILGPEQIAGVRAASGEPWTEVTRDSLDTGRAYRWYHRDGSRRSIALCVFDGPLSRAVAFGDAATRAENLLDAVQAAAERSHAQPSGDGQRLVLCASDGELWGHHKKFADLTLAFATGVEAPRRGIDATNLGAYLAKNPPVWEARLATGPDDEGTAWSCGHGLGRWTRDCGCHMSGDAGWNQAWRGPLRRALDIVRDAAGAFYEDAASEWLVDPWGARDAYGDAVDDPVPVRDELLAEFGRPALAAGGEAAAAEVRRLLELQRATLLMYASCGWFFDDIAGLEASLVIRMAAHALDILGEAGGEPPVNDVLDALAEGKSNRREEGTGADVFRRVSRDRVTAAHAVGASALETLVSPSAAPGAGTGFDVAFTGRRAADAGGTRTLDGTARARQRRTGTTSELTVDASVRRGGEFLVTVDGQAYTLEELGEETRSAIAMAALPTLLPDIQNPAVARLVVAAAKGMPPDGETPEGVTRRADLTRALLGLLGHPTAETLRLAGELLDVLDLPSGSPDRRVLEERVWALLAQGRQTPPLRALASKLGFAVAEETIVQQSAS